MHCACLLTVPSSEVAQWRFPSVVRLRLGRCVVQRSRQGADDALPADGERRVEDQRLPNTLSSEITRPPRQWQSICGDRWESVEVARSPEALPRALPIRPDESEEVKSCDRSVSPGARRRRAYAGMLSEAARSVMPVRPPISFRGRSAKTC
eukprot:gene10166-biopygen5112